MQKQENFFKKQSDRAKFKRKNMILTLHEKLKEKGRDEVTARARKIASGMGIFLLSLILSYGRMPYDTYPLSIALICGVGEYYIWAFLGACVGGIANELGREYIFSFIAVFVIRLFVLTPFAPKNFLQKRESFKINFYGDGENAAPRIDGAHAKVFYKIKIFIYELFGISEENAAERKSVLSFFDEVGQRLIISLAGGFICGLFLLIRNDFSYYSLAALIFMMILCPTVSLLFSGLSSGRRTGFVSTVSLLCAMLLAVYSADGLTVLSLAISPFLAMLFTLIATRSRGLASGIFMAAFTGLCFEARCIPVLLLSALAYAMLSEIKKGAALALIVGICLMWSYYFFDIASFVFFMPPMLVSLPIFLVFEKFMHSYHTKSKKTFEENKYFAKSVSEESKNLAVKAKVTSLSEAFSSLSKTVSSLSDKFSRPDMLGLRAITDKGFERTCEGCPNFDVCFGAEYDRTVKAMGKITSALHKRGYVCEDDLDEDFSLICVRRKKLVEEMNLLCAERTESILRSKSLSFFASSYDDIKDILQDAVVSGGDEYECDTVVGSKIYEYLRSQGYEADGVVVCGKRCKRVMLKGVNISKDAHDGNAKALCKKISEIVGVKMIGPVFEVGDDGMLMLFSAKPKFRAVCAGGRRAVFENGEEETREVADTVNPFDSGISEKREELCGDVTNAFLTDTSYFYSLISDGMGSGAEAATSAGISSMFCEKMLMAGNRADITIRMLNNFLRGENTQRGSECSVTVDLFELDLMLGVASFIKSGAAPTYILRRSEVYKVASKTMPVGIIKNPDIKVTRFDMKRGDLVLMMSDGVCGEGEECEWIVETLCETKLPENFSDSSEGEKFAADLRDKIFEIARKKMNLSGKLDDMSVSVVLVL